MKISKIIAQGETIIYRPRLTKWAYLHLGSLIKNLTTTIFVSDKRFFHSHGWINRHAHEIVISKVESILVEQIKAIKSIKKGRKLRSKPNPYKK